MIVNEKRQAWKLHYDKLLIDEFSWSANSLSEELPVLAAATKITKEMVLTAISEVKAGKDTNPWGIVTDMVKAAGTNISF